MRESTPIVHAFEKLVRQQLPQLAAGLRDGAADGHGNYLLLDFPLPGEPGRCKLSVLYRVDCLEIRLFVSELRGPAERQILIDEDMPGSIAAAVDFLRAIISGDMLVDLVRHRFLWLKPRLGACFRRKSDPPRGHIVETLRWEKARIA